MLPRAGTRRGTSPAPKKIHLRGTRKAIPGRAAASPALHLEQRVFTSGSWREKGARSVHRRRFALVATCRSQALQRGTRRRQAALGAACHILPLFGQPTPPVKLSIPRLLDQGYEFWARSAEKYLFWLGFGFFSLNPATNPVRSSCCSFSPLPPWEQLQEHAPGSSLETAILDLLFKNWIVLPGHFVFKLHWLQSTILVLWNTEHNQTTPALPPLKIRIRNAVWRI